MVVLIIGILAAVALPQYKKAVFKARLMQGMPLAKRIADEAEVFYMANGYFPTADELGIAEIENDQYSVYCANANGKEENEPSDCGVVGVAAQGPYGHLVALFLAPMPDKVFESEDLLYSYKRFCIITPFVKTWPLAEAICRSFGGEKLADIVYSW